MPRRHNYLRPAGRGYRGSQYLLGSEVGSLIAKSDFGRDHATIRPGAKVGVNVGAVGTEASL